MGGQLEVHHIT